MASQRITIVKLGGLASEVALLHLRDWSRARQASDPEEWSADQWPPDVRKQADAFADRLRSHATDPPIIHFVEWADLWSMGDLFDRWMTPPGAAGPITVHADRFEIRGYRLPDDGRLGRHLSTPASHFAEEANQFVIRLHEAVEAWQDLVDRAALVVLREVVGGLVMDEELVSSLELVPDWLLS
ncbi:hypothetical protein P12x_000368 [Tundrisphaera lichenicola]|uniref:hypothetical protein n=1 Tax=Tundrisphaera lichenicola TaxID=2029860 RepID=UPI003EB831A7